MSLNTNGKALNDKQFESALENSDLLVLDDIGIALNSILINVKIKNISGQNCFEYLIELANKEFFNVIIRSYSPPYRNDISNEDNKLTINTMNDLKPDILFIGLTAPKQYKWTYEYRYLIIQVTD